MIEGIDIANLGSFKGFEWDSVRDAGRNRAHFKTVNLLYGRNCTGKTTLSRILRAMETGELPPNYEAPAFTLHMDGGTITEAGVVGTKRNVRVYNRDFVEKYLGILRSPSGSIETFAIFGAENKKIEEEIAAKTAALGSVEGKTGLLFEQSTTDGEYVSARCR
jgi:wobble nucleotide-excising tRNase